jgi:hypothetical protein
VSSALDFIGYVPGDTDDVGFVNPVCRREGTYFIKVQDLTSRNTVEHPVQLGEFVKAEPARFLSDPEKVVLGFLLENELFVGDMDGLRSFVETTAQNYVVTRPSLQLQIAELWGSEGERAAARKAFTSVLQDRLGRSASEYFVDSSLAREIVATLILKNVKEGTSKEDFATSFRSALLHFHPHYDDPVPNDVWVRLKKHLTIDKSELYARFEREWKPVSQSLVRDRARPLDRHGDQREDADTAQEQFRSLSRLSRQEWRIARLLRSYLEDKEAAERLSSIYWTKNKFETRAIELIRSSLDYLPLRDSDLEKQIAYLIPRLMKMEFPANRGVLLFDLARELSTSEPSRNVIDAELHRRGHTWAVYQFKELILRELELGAKAAAERQA